MSAGGDRQNLHEVVRKHSMACAAAVSRGEANNLLECLANDPGFFRVPAEQLRAELDPIKYTGRASAQVGEFLQEYLHPLLGRARPLAAQAEIHQVTV